jgi:hypothetical protein
MGDLPNEQVLPSVDVSTIPSLSLENVDQNGTFYEWSWTYVPSRDDTNVCSFFEYNAKDNGFRVLCTFSFCLFGKDKLFN